MTSDPDAVGLLMAARPDDLDRVDEATRSRVLAKARLAAGRSPAPRRAAGRRRVRAAALGAGVAAAAVAAGLVLAPGEHGRPPAVPARPDPAAAAVLLAAAVHVQAAPAATMGRYWHTLIRIGWLSCAPPPGTPGTAARWLAMQSERWVAASPSDATWFTTLRCAPGRPVLQKADPRDWSQRRFDVEGQELTIADLARLPTDPAALRAFLLAPYPAGYQQSYPVKLVQRLFGEAADLTVAPVQPAVRAAVYRLLAGLPGIEVLGPVRDAVGRPGTAIAIPDGQVLHELIIDPRTGAVLDTQDVTRAHGQTTVMSYDAILVSGWTDTVTPTPPAPHS